MVATSTITPSTAPATATTSRNGRVGPHEQTQTEPQETGAHERQDPARPWRPLRWRTRGRTRRSRRPGWRRASRRRSGCPRSARRCAGAPPPGVSPHPAGRSAISRSSSSRSRRIAGDDDLHVRRRIAIAQPVGDIDVPTRAGDQDVRPRQGRAAADRDRGSCRRRWRRPAGPGNRGSR